MAFSRIRWLLSCMVVSVVGISAAQTVPPPAAASAAVYVPDMTHANDPMPEGVFAWDALQKTAAATNDQVFVSFGFSFTNVSSRQVAILRMIPSCGCTTVEMPPVPWLIPSGGAGAFSIKVNLEGKTGTLFKTVGVSTEMGRKDLLLRIDIQEPPPMPKMSEEQRAAGIAASRVDRQAVFRGDCATCHLKKVQGKYGQPLFQALCAICHEDEHRASMVPDLHRLPVTTSEEYWRTWITLGKPGSLMPAFSTSQGGPLNDLQIASLAAYLNAVIPPRPATNAPAATNTPAR